ncbi:class I adenylate-forming enzyme family protein [Brucella anthropi]|uniref:class I adenylate-forming enzyme family protein n=1 Tax=Brucella anthropi TaxID=529 RepID=UPI001CFE24E3|nr:class I adenylate-forming enzyme family protein [Brucella anthropi]
MIEGILREAEADIKRIEALYLGENISQILFDAEKDVPSQTALNFFEDKDTLTYQQLANLVRQFAVGLKNAGIGVGDSVGVMIANRREFPISWLALMTIGAVMVPINTRYTPREVQFVLEHSQSKMLIIDGDLLDSLNSEKPIYDIYSGPIISTSEYNSVFSAALLNDLISNVSEDEAKAAIHPEITSKNLANIQFTSGSTGMPKGCRQTHTFWLEVSMFIAQAYLPAAKNYLLHQSFFYMDPQFLMLAAFRNRGTAFIARRPSATRYFDWIEKNNIEYIFLPEFIYKQNDLKNRKFPSLKHGMIFGWGSHNHVAAENDLGITLREGFGMTEIGIATYMPKNASEMVGSRSCGVVAPFRDCKIMRDEENECEPDEVGEIWVKGDGVITAYHNNPEANEKSFYKEWFKSGDLGRRDKNGFFYYSGRLKDMIRRSGENISAQEVEAVLRTAPGVVEASVVPFKDEMRGEEVKAYLTCVEGIELKSNSAALDQIYKTCQENLASFKIPRYIEQVSEFPRTGSNKIAKQVFVAGRSGVQSDHFDKESSTWIPVA